MNLDQLEAREKLLEKELEEIKRQKEIIGKPLSAMLTEVIISPASQIFELKFSKVPEQNITDKIRQVRGRSYIFAREVNQFPISELDTVKAILAQENIEFTIPSDKQAEIDNYNNSPDFRLEYDSEKSNIIIFKTVRYTFLPYIYDLTTFNENRSKNLYTFSVNEIQKWMEIQAGFIRNHKWKFELSDEVIKIYEKEIDKDKILDQFADMKDAPEFNHIFPQINPKTGKNYELEPDQRVAIKFDDLFGNRSLISYDMGKGKTAIAIAQAERHKERVLFICKADLKTNIKKEIKKFTGKDTIIFSGIRPDGLAVDSMIKNKKQYNILNYDIVGRGEKVKNAAGDITLEVMPWVELINLAGFDRIIYDEAHYMKNMEAQRSKGGRGLKAPKVMLLTGTPVVNRPGEIFPILSIIDPAKFNDYSTFLHQYTDRNGYAKNLPSLHKILKKYMIRRLRDIKDNPERIPVYIELSAGAKKSYQQVLDGLYVALREPDSNPSKVTNILTQLLRLKQITADDKVDFTVSRVEETLDEQPEELAWKKILVFSQFKATQAAIQARLGSKAKIINGDVTDKARYDIIDKFQDRKSDLKVIITNITEGITLTEAGTTIINDLWWTPKDHMQAEGRAFGRTNDPHGGNSYYILCEDTIDDMIWNILEKKLVIFKSVVDEVYTQHPETDQSMFSELVSMLKNG